MDYDEQKSVDDPELAAIVGKIEEQIKEFKQGKQLDEAAKKDLQYAIDRLGQSFDERKRHFIYIYFWLQKPK